MPKFGIGIAEPTATRLQKSSIYNILLAGAYYPEEQAAGGGCLTHARIAEGLSRLGHRVAMATIVEPGNEALEVAGTQRLNIPLQGSLSMAPIAMRRRLSKSWPKEPTVYHASDFFGVCFWDRPFILQLHYPNFTRKHLLSRQGLQTAIGAHLARYLLFYTRYSMNQFIKILRLNPDKCRVIGGGVDLALFNMRKKYYGPGRPFCISTAGRPEPNKGTDILIGAASILKSAGRSFKIDIYGDSPNCAEYRRLACDLGMQERIIFHGKLRRFELYARLIESDLFCFPSRYESCGLAALEAAALGIPLIAAERTGTAETLNAQVARMVPELDPESWAGAIMDCMDNYAGCRTRALLALEHVRQHHGWDIVVRRVEDVYREFLHY